MQENHHFKTYKTSYITLEIAPKASLMQPEEHLQS